MAKNKRVSVNTQSGFYVSTMVNQWTICINKTLYWCYHIPTFLFYQKRKDGVFFYDSYFNTHWNTYTQYMFIHRFIRWFVKRKRKTEKKGMVLANCANWSGLRIMSKKKKTLNCLPLPTNELYYVINMAQWGTKNDMKMNPWKFENIY